MYPWIVLMTTIVVAVALGIAAQIIAERFQLPAILPLLMLGICCGPAGLMWFHPESLGDLLEVVIHLGVAVILFEGGLSLDHRRLAKVGAAVRNLITLGAVVTGVAGAWLAHDLTGLPWGPAALFGAIVTVTGPTVVVPLLHHMVAPREVKTVLVSEGLIIDPVGAVLAYFVLQWIERAGIPLREMLSEVAVLAAAGIVVGFAAGSAARLVVRKRWLTGELRNLTVLALLLLAYFASESQAEQSGILAAVVMGLTVSAAELPDLGALKVFKGQLTTLVISVLFILLAGQLDVAGIAHLGLSGLAVVGGLILLVRPASVLASVWGGQLDWKAKTVLAMTAPRGIVAAAVASLSARRLATVGMPGGETLEGLVYLTILVTGAWATAMALLLPWVLGYLRDPARRRVVLLGANPLAEAVAEMLVKLGRTVVVVDGTCWRLDRFRNIGTAVVCGDAREATTWEEAGVERDTTVLCLTTNDELNLLAAEELRTEFGVEHPVAALQHPPEDLGRRSRAWLDLLGGGAVDVPAWTRRLDSGEAEVVEVELNDERVLAAVREVEREAGGDLLRLFRWSDGEPSFRFSLGHATEGKLVALVTGHRAVELLAELMSAGDGPPEQGEPEGEEPQNA